MSSINLNDFEVGEGRFSISYSSSDRRLLFNMASGEGAKQNFFHIFIAPFPQWHSPHDYSIIGPVSEDQRQRILNNIRIEPEKKGYHCAFVDQDGDIVNPGQNNTEDF